MTIPPATSYSPEALLRRFIKLYYALGFHRGSSADQKSFEKWFNMWWMCLFVYIKGIRPVPWYDARWWRISEDHRKEVLNLVVHWGAEAEKGELMLNELPYPHELGIDNFEKDVFDMMPQEALEIFRRAIRPSDCDPAALGEGAANSLGHSIFGRYSHRQRAIYGV
ncbi:hypothetical protein JCM10295v2_007100 [Rhodotorula toruloides]